MTTFLVVISTIGFLLLWFFVSFYYFASQLGNKGYRPKMSPLRQVAEFVIYIPVLVVACGAGFFFQLMKRRNS